MKVYNLVCHLDHHFEGWFASEADALEQQENGLLTCPMCDSHEVSRLPSAPRIAKHSNREVTKVSAPEEGASMGNSMVLTGQEQANLQAKVQATVMKAMRELISKTEDVGSDFAKRLEKFITAKLLREVFVVTLLLTKQQSCVKRALKWLLYQYCQRLKIRCNKHV